MNKRFNEALRVLGEASIDPLTKQQAHNYLNEIPAEDKAHLLVEALDVDDFVVRWEAGKMLSEIGKPALSEILKALVDPQKAGDSRLRGELYHVLRSNHDPVVRELTKHLREDMHGFGADLKTLYDADSLLREISKH